MEILKVENLKRVYGTGASKVVALDNVSFTVEKGEFVSIVGASGSGKSTLLHLIGGVDRATKGKVFIDDLELNSAYLGTGLSVYTLSLTLKNKKAGKHKEIVEALSSLDYVSYVEEI